MTTILFSANFSYASKQHRLEYLEQVLRAAEVPLKFVVFNITGRVDASFDVVNAEDYSDSVKDDWTSALRRLIDEVDPRGESGLWEQARGEHEASGKNFPKSARRMYRNLLAFLDAIHVHNPTYVYLWNQFNAFHTIVAAILKARGIRFGFFHDGVLPGSIALDVDGEMGESWVARRPDLFSKVRITDEDRDRAGDYYKHMVSERSSRHPQRASINFVKALSHAGLEGRPIVFYAGQNDWHAGVKPDSTRRLNHSPSFKGSLEALDVLDQVATELDLAIVYKPHPLDRDKYAFLSASNFRSSLVLQSIDLNDAINRSSVVCTIASQVAYSGIFAGKPVLMLGRNQLYGKNLTYDVSDVESLRTVLELAIADPLISAREIDTIEHLARLEKAYLFDFGTSSTPFFRRGPAAAARFMHLCARNSPEDVVDTLVSN